MLYIDTSVIVSLLADEAAAQRVEIWFAGLPAEPVAVSEWTLTEVASALAIKRRTGQLSDGKYEAATQQFRLMLETSFQLLPVATRHFQAAVHYCSHETALRSGDALHLAVAMDAGAEIITLDRRFAASAKSLSARATLL